MQKETKKVTFEKTGNELFALLKENEELRRNRPKFNQRPKARLFSVGVYQYTSEEGYITLYKAPINVNGSTGLVTTFVSKNAALNAVLTPQRPLAMNDDLSSSTMRHLLALIN